MNFLEGGVVANAKENKIIDDEIFVRRNILSKKNVYWLYVGKKFYIIGYFEWHMVSEETSIYIEK